MKLTVTLKMQRSDGEHKGRITFEIPDSVMGNPVEAMLIGLPISAELLDGLIFLMAHVDDEDEETSASPIPEAFRKAFN